MKWNWNRKIGLLSMKWSRVVDQNKNIMFLVAYGRPSNRNVIIFIILINSNFDWMHKQTTTSERTHTLSSFHLRKNGSWNFQMCIPFGFCYFISIFSCCEHIVRTSNKVAKGFFSLQNPLALWLWILCRSIYRVVYRFANSWMEALRAIRKETERAREEKGRVVNINNQEREVLQTILQNCRN